MLIHMVEDTARHAGHLDAIPGIVRWAEGLLLILKVIAQSNRNPESSRGHAVPGMLLPTDRTAIIAAEERVSAETRWRSVRLVGDDGGCSMDRCCRRTM